MDEDEASGLAGERESPACGGFAFEGAEHALFGVEDGRDAVDEKVGTFFGGEEERIASGHDLFLDAELVIAIDEAVVSFEVDAGGKFPLRFDGSRGGCGVAFGYELHDTVLPWGSDKCTNSLD